eukprot:125531-Prymnesium_polylepis.1
MAAAAEGAALLVARHLGPEASAAEAAAASSEEMTAEEARRLAAAEGLALVPSSKGQTGFKGVSTSGS